MITKRARLAMLFVVPLLIPIAVDGQMRVEMALFEPIPTLSINTCSLGRALHGAAWAAMMATAGMESDSAKDLLIVLRDSLRVEVDERPTDVELQYVLAAVIGARAEFECGLGQIRAAKALHAQTRTVLRLDPDHPGAQHILGRLHLAVLRMSRVKRFLATRVLGGSELSGASWDEAQQLLEAAVIGDPCVADHHYELAPHYAARGETARARDRIEQLLRLDLTAPRNEVVIERAVDLLQQLENAS